MTSDSGIVSLPVGTILAYAAPTLGHLPSNWRLCDGSTYLIDDYFDLYRILGQSNPGGDDQHVAVPDLQGRSIRGNADAQTSSSPRTGGSPHDPAFNPVGQAALNPGMVSPFKAANDPVNPISVTFDRMPNNEMHDGGRWNFPPHYSLIDWTSNTTNFSITGGDEEVRPVNIYMYYIIKVLSETGITDGINIPIGAVIPFAGQNSVTAGDANDWLSCDGRTVDTSSFLGLDQCLAGCFTWPGTEGTGIPNLNGMFIRGYDVRGMTDPDISTRTAAPNGNSSGVGSFQNFATALGNASMAIPYYATQSSDYAEGFSFDCFDSGNSSSNQSWRGVGAETRPNNACVQFCINTVTDDQTNKSFPIGGIIAIPGGGRLDSSEGWVECEGGSTNPSASLAAILGNVWGEVDGSGQTIPDLRSQFLRGYTPQGSNGAYSPQGGPDTDPEHSTRVSYNDLSTNLDGVGSYQQYSLAQPKNPLQINITYPTNDNSTSSGGSNVAQYQGYQANAYFPTGFDNEVAPVHTVVTFWMYAPSDD